MKIQKKPFLKNSAAVTLIAVFCCALWGSATPLIKIGYELMLPEGDAASTVLFAGIVIANLNGLDLSVTLLGEGFVFFATVAYGISSSLMKRYSHREDPVVISGYQFMIRWIDYDGSRNFNGRTRNGIDDSGGFRFRIFSYPFCRGVFVMGAIAAV